jgi:hypothetical protein
MLITSVTISCVNYKYVHSIRINTILLSEGTTSSDNTPIEQSYLSTPTPTVSSWRQAAQRSPLFHFAVGLGPGVQFNKLQSVLYFYSPYLKTAMEIFSFGLQAGVTYIKDVICMSKCYELRKPARRDWRQLSVSDNVLVFRSSMCSTAVQQ